MLLASVNLNKRLGAAGARSNLAAWLREHGIKAVLAREPFKPADRTPPLLSGFTFAGGDGRLAAWTSEDLAPPAVSSPKTWVQRIELEWMVVLQLHLDAYAGASRAAQLAELAAMAAAEDGRPLLICGDFNLAPRPEDGLFGEETSTFTTDAERQTLQQLMHGAGLVDTTVETAPAFTFERVFSGKLSRFRCDLALLSDHLTATTTITPDVTVRTGPRAFTDHSALLIDLPVTLHRAEPDNVLFALSDLTGQSSVAQARRRYQPHKTAMSRQAPSPASRAVTEHLTGPLGVTSVLDHGCGRGTDVAHYRSAGLDAEGFDPHDDFGWPRSQRTGFDLVTSMFVLNVLPDPWQRIQALKDAASFARPGGHVVVVTRSPEEITKAAAEGGWMAHLPAHGPQCERAVVHTRRPGVDRPPQARLPPRDRQGRGGLASRRFADLVVIPHGGHEDPSVHETGQG
ncbi:Endonuclease/Exonuclease/phosphatase family protein [Sinosporangium album]|uniref:Endonuclease/Exonuclease/phosphatase family protein n=1 Tax=Sinosporangium album TaxID=504805 RepID=A0A1G8BSC1_9ACTN|nr:methyltransferase domain-containing protein [Sinosporangium album]SDH35983.1 Endonuclease/Exonuclease/phosphatase family protein [Sinosporangium album]